MVSDRKRSRLGCLLAGTAAALAALGGFVATAAPASAHPLGNFTTNVYGGLVVQPERVLIDYVVDLAEIPTVRARNDVDRLGEKQWAAGECDRLARGVNVHDGDRAPATTVRSSAMAFGDGAGGLSVLRLSCGMAAARQGGGTRVELRYEDTNFPGRVGWREVTANGDGTTLWASDVPVDSTSDRLTSYPEDLLSSPLRVSSARLEVTPGGRRLEGVEGAGSEAPGAGGVSIAGDQLTRRFTALVGRQHIDTPFVLLAIVLATLLGAVHAFAPGHGKTVMAAYLVGQRGTTRQAVIIGVTVTATHTFGVLLLGLLLSASSILAPERIYPWLTVASGVLFASIGIRLLVGALRQRRAVRQRDHSHDHAHEHGLAHAHKHQPAHAQVHELVHACNFAHAGDPGHWPHEPAPAQAHDHAGGQAHLHAEDHDHSADPVAESELEHAHGGLVHRHALPDPDGAPIGWRSLFVLGLAGGMVPTPSALIVLLGAIALGRVWLGVGLVLAYGAGMAAALTGTGLLLLRARGMIEARTAHWRHKGVFVVVGRVLPLATAGLIILAGSAVVARGAAGL